MLRTPLFPVYEKYGAKTIDFGGWELPVRFAGIQQEHDAVRTQAGLFDVSHMGEFRVQGTEAEAFLQGMLTNDLAKARQGQAQYTLMCYADGGVVDDLLVYKLSGEDFMLVVNAANRQKDWEWLKQHVEGDVSLTDVSDETVLLALQGPAAANILAKLTALPITTLKPFRFMTDVPIAGAQGIVSRTGYTGEDGFEIYAPAEHALALWEALLEAGKEDGLVPAGLGARDTLRFEAALPLYGQELSAAITPLEAGLGFFVKLDKADFIGKEALLTQQEHGPKRRLVGLEMAERGIPRPHYQVFADGKLIGEVTTGTQSPTLKSNIGLALIDAAYAQLGAEVEVDVRGKRVRANVVKTPFYKRSN